MREKITILMTILSLSIGGCSGRDITITPEEKHLFYSYFDSVQKVAMWKHVLYDRNRKQELSEVLNALRAVEKEKALLWKKIKRTKSLKWVAKKQRQREKDVFSGRIGLVEYYEPYYELRDKSNEEGEK